MAQNKPRYVSTFRAPTEYERQLEEARRRAALAEALAQQEYQPMEGNAAPIPKAAPLVKALQGYLTAREGRKAREAAEEAKGMEADYAQRMLGRMQGGRPMGYGPPVRSMGQPQMGPPRSPQVGGMMQRPRMPAPAGMTTPQGGSYRGDFENAS